MKTLEKNKIKYNKSPLNYIGGKYRLLNQIIPLFPNDIENFVDLFAGGCNVSININADKIYCNDNLTYLIDLYKEMKFLDFDFIIDHIEQRIKKFNLSKTNEIGFKAIRELYNEERNPLDLFVLIAFSFNHQIRFNNKHRYNNPFGKDRSSFNSNMKDNLKSFVLSLKAKEISFTNYCFNDFDFSFLTNNDLVYCDPPYLITSGSYNDGKRGFKGWTTKEEIELLKTLDSLNESNIKFALSNVLEHKDLTNDLLINWLANNPNYNTHYLNMNYSNSNYQSKNKTKSIEVLITNY